MQLKLTEGTVMQLLQLQITSTSGCLTTLMDQHLLISGGSCRKTVQATSLHQHTYMANSFWTCALVLVHPDTNQVTSTLTGSEDLDL